MNNDIRPIDAISRSALLEWLEYMVSHSIGGAEYAYKTTKRLVTSAPALDAAPVVHAKWIEDGYRGIPCVCSHCSEEAHYTSTFREQFDYDWEENLVPCGYEEIREYIRSNCCPNCGARMDGDEGG